MFAARSASLPTSWAGALRCREAMCRTSVQALTSRHRALPDATREGDVVLVDSTGAYGFCMASPYNMRAPPAELIFDHESVNEPN